MIQKLELDGRGEDMRFVTSVAKSLFADGTTNWGRIASLVSFGAALCQALEAGGKEGCVSLVAQQISSYLLSYQREWLLRNNSWVRCDISDLGSALPVKMFLLRNCFIVPQITRAKLCLQIVI